MTHNKPASPFAPLIYRTAAQHLAEQLCWDFHKVSQGSAEQITVIFKTTNTITLKGLRSVAQSFQTDNIRIEFDIIDSRYYEPNLAAVADIIISNVDPQLLHAAYTAIME